MLYQLACFTDVSDDFRTVEKGSMDSVLSTNISLRKAFF
jgi:hypothetical protein